MKLRSCAILFAVTLVASTLWAQSIVMDTKPVTITPGATVGNKIRVKWQVQKQAGVMLQVFDAAGKCMLTLDAGDMAPGDYNVIFDGRDLAGKPLPAGDYTLRLSATPKVEADLTFGAGGMLGQATQNFTFQKDRKFNLGVKNVDAKSVTVKVDGETWDQEEDQAIAGNNYKVDAANGVVEINPTATLDKGAEITISLARGVPLEDPYVVKTAPDGSLFISDAIYGLDLQNKKPKPRNGNIYKVDANGKLVTTFGKNGAVVGDAKDMAVDADGNLYFIGLYHAIAVLDSQGKLRYTLADYTDPSGAGKDKPVRGGYWPMSIAMNEARRIVMVNIDQTNVLYDATKPDLTGFIACQFGKQGAESAPVLWQYIGPNSAAIGDYFYTTTCYNRLIKYKFDAQTKEFATIWSTPLLSPEADAKYTGPSQLWNALDVEVDGTGLIYVADRTNHRVQIFFDAGSNYKFVGSLGSEGSSVEKCQLMAPHAISVSPDRKSLYVADDGIFIKWGNNPIVKGLARVVKWKLGAQETLDAKLTVK